MSLLRYAGLPAGYSRSALAAARFLVAHPLVALRLAAWAALHPRLPGLMIRYLELVDYEGETVRLFRDTVRPGDTVVDVGAHLGYYSIVAAASVGPTGKVYAFEPDPVNARLLRETLSVRGARNVVPVQMAVSSQNGRARLRISTIDTGDHYLVGKKRERERELRARFISSVP